MEQIIYYRCEECGKKFESKEEANKHEQFCSRKNIPIKVICFTDCNEFEIITYPDAIYLKQENGKDKVNLMPKDRHEWCDYFYDASQFKFDQIKQNNGDVFIYTTNFSKEYENECFKKIIDFKINDIEENINLLKQTVIILKNTKDGYNNKKEYIRQQKNVFVEELDS